MTTSVLQRWPVSFDMKDQVEGHAESTSVMVLLSFTYNSRFNSFPFLNISYHNFFSVMFFFWSVPQSFVGNREHERDRQNGRKKKDSPLRIEKKIGGTIK